MPGQRQGEEAEYRTWREHGDKTSFTSLHGPMYVPRRVEDSGRYGYSAYGSLGVFIHDLSDIQHPRSIRAASAQHPRSIRAASAQHPRSIRAASAQHPRSIRAASAQHPRPIGRSNPEHKPGAILFHTVDVSRLDRGFVIVNPEVLQSRLQRAVSAELGPTNPRRLDELPVPTPPPDAPYRDFCDKRGRFGPHNPPHLKAPGTPHPNFTAYSFFNAGLQLYDITDPARPRSAGYFIAPQPGSLDDYLSYPRDTDAVFVEWDRRLMWVGTRTGLYLVTSPALGKPVLAPMPVARWSLPGMNAGHP